MGLDVRMNVSVSDTGGGGGGKWRAPKDDIIQVVKPKGAKGARSIDIDEVGSFVLGLGLPVLSSSSSFFELLEFLFSFRLPV